MTFPRLVLLVLIVPWLRIAPLGAQQPPLSVDLSSDTLFQKMEKSRAWMELPEESRELLMEVIEGSLENERRVKELTYLRLEGYIENENREYDGPPLAITQKGTFALFRREGSWRWSEVTYDVPDRTEERTKSIIISEGRWIDFHRNKLASGEVEGGIRIDRFEAGSWLDRIRLGGDSEWTSIGMSSHLAHESAATLLCSWVSELEWNNRDSPTKKSLTVIREQAPDGPKVVVHQVTFFQGQHDPAVTGIDSSSTTTCLLSFVPAQGFQVRDARMEEWEARGFVGELLTTKSYQQVVTPTGEVAWIPKQIQNTLMGAGQIALSNTLTIESASTQEDSVPIHLFTLGDLKPYGLVVMDSTVVPTSIYTYEDVEGPQN